MGVELIDNVMAAWRRSPIKQRRRGGAPSSSAVPRQAATEHQLIYSTFPMNKMDFPDHGDMSFRTIKIAAEEIGVDIQIRSRRTKNLGKRAPAVVTIRGLNCKEVYAWLIKVAWTLKHDLRMVLLPHEIWLGESGRLEPAATGGAPLFFCGDTT